jgi:hypothetical protein
MHSVNVGFGEDRGGSGDDRSGPDEFGATGRYDKF